MDDIRNRAKELMKGYCRVCPICDGRACVGEVPGMGSLGTGSSFKANLAALARHRINMRLIHDVTAPDTGTQLWGKALGIPILAAPIGGVSFNMGGAVSEQDYIEAVLGACLEQGTWGCTGDGVPDFIHESGLNGIRNLGGEGIPFIKPWESDELDLKLEKAAASGASVVGIDVDAAGLVTLRKMGRPVSPKTPAQLREIVDKTPMKVVLKGIMTVDEAKCAVDVGAAGIVVSNHGGRVLDHTPGAAEVLPAISEAVAGQIPVLADGGVRTGIDVLKLLALGADAVMVGRPISIAAIGGLKEGVAKYLDVLKQELIQGMVLTGSRDIVSIDRRILFD